MELSDCDQHNPLWKIGDLKNPTGSKGNHKEFHSMECLDQRTADYGHYGLELEEK